MKIWLKEEFFLKEGCVLAENGQMKAYAFRYNSGVAALKIENPNGYFIILPFQGQIVWEAYFNDRKLSMQTTVTEPVPTKEFLKNYGGFIYHCGLGSVGAPDSNHPHHGEIPNEDYSVAYLMCGEDVNGAYMSVGGTIEHNVAFVKKYKFSPECKLYENDTVLNVSVSIKNCRSECMEYAYLCHINFKPVDGARLYYNAKLKTVHKAIPDSLETERAQVLAEFMDKIEAEPHNYDVLCKDEQCYDPEICCTYLYEGEYGYTIQHIENEGAYYVKHNAKALPYAIRWISRTGTEDAMGMVLPATCEHLGYQYIKENNQIKYLAPYEEVKFDFQMGWLQEGDKRLLSVLK